MSADRSFEDAIMRAVLAERERIAQELLSDTVHALFRIVLDLESLASSTADSKVAERLRGSVSELDKAIADLRHKVATGVKEWDV